MYDNNKINTICSYQEYVAVPKRMMLVPLPAEFQLDSACLLACSGLTSYNAVTQINEALKTQLTHFSTYQVTYFSYVEN